MVCERLDTLIAGFEEISHNKRLMALIMWNKVKTFSVKIIRRKKP